MLFFFNTARVVLIDRFYSTSFTFQCAWLRADDNADLYVVFQSECTVAEPGSLAPRASNYSGRIQQITDLTRSTIIYRRYLYLA